MQYSSLNAERTPKGLELLKPFYLTIPVLRWAWKWPRKHRPEGHNEYILLEVQVSRYILFCLCPSGQLFPYLFRCFVPIASKEWKNTLKNLAKAPSRETGNFPKSDERREILRINYNKNCFRITFNICKLTSCALRVGNKIFRLPRISNISACVYGR